MSGPAADGGSAGDPSVLLARSAKLRLFVMLRRTSQPDLLRGHLGAHLQWMIGREKAGAIFLSGPILPRPPGQPAGPSALDGLTIIQADSLAAAEAIAAEDPFVRAGVVTFDLCEWVVNEGSLAMTVTLSDSTVTFR